MGVGTKVGVAVEGLVTGTGSGDGVSGLTVDQEGSTCRGFP